MRLHQTGYRLQNRLFIAYVRGNQLDCCRLGITVTRQVGKANTRNRIKRLAREYFRLNRHGFEKKLDISIIAKRECAELPNHAITRSLGKIFVRIAAYKA